MNDGGGAIGGAVARAFADAGARVYLAGRSRARLEKVANDIGDAAGVAEVDALDERAIAEHADAVAADAGGIDIATDRPRARAGEGNRGGSRNPPEPARLRDLRHWSGGAGRRH